MSVTARMEAWLERASDGMSPLVVKEARQSVRGREFLISFAVSLIAGLSVAFIGATMALSGSSLAGRWTFAALIGCLAFLGLAVVPLGAFSRLRHERTDQTLELITLTSLSSRRIVVGKLLAQSVKLMTLFAGIAPFLAMSFLLGGIDLATILMTLVMLYMASVWMGAACLFLSTLFKGRAASGLVFAAIGLLVILMLFIGTAIFQAISRGAVIPSMLGLGTATAVRLKEFAIVITFWTTTLVNFVLLAENRLSLATEDTVTPLRLGFFTQFVLMAAWGLMFWLTTYHASTADVLFVAALVHLAGVAAFVVTEGLTAPRRILQQMRTATGPRKLLAWFGPGAGRGAAYVLLQMVLLALVWATFLPAPEDWHRLFAALGYILFFTGVPVVLFRTLAPARASALTLRVAVLCGVAAAMIVPDIVHYIVVRPETLDLNFTGRHLLSPFRAISNWTYVERNNWTIVPMLIGITGLLAYVQIIRIGAVATARATDAGLEPVAVQEEAGRGVVAD